MICRAESSERSSGVVNEPSSGIPETHSPPSNMPLYGIPERPGPMIHPSGSLSLSPHKYTQKYHDIVLEICRFLNGYLDLYWVLMSLSCSQHSDLLVLSFEP